MGRFVWALIIRAPVASAAVTWPAAPRALHDRRELGRGEPREFESSWTGAPNCGAWLLCVAGFHRRTTLWLAG